MLLEWMGVPAARVALSACSLLAAGALAAPSAPTAAASGEPISVVYRFDDYSSHSAIDFERRLLDAFRARKARLAVAVIPMASGNELDPAASDTLPLNDEKADLLKRSIADGTVEVILHGLHHERRLGLDKYSEYNGLPVETQTAMLEHGRELLEARLGVPVAHFCPPWNNYDANTVSALEAAGFKSLSARIRGETKPGSTLKFLPTTWGGKNVPAAVKTARALGGSDRLVLATFHAYDFKESGDKRAIMSLADFEKELDWVLAQPDVKVTGFDGAIAAVQDLSAKRLGAAGEYLNSQFYYLAPSPFPSPSFPGAYATRPWLEKQARKLRLFCLWAYGGSAVGALLLLALLGGRMPPPVFQALRVAAPLAFAAVLALHLRAGEPWYPKKAAVACVLLGAAVGLWLARSSVPASREASEIPR